MADLIPFLKEKIRNRKLRIGFLYLGLSNTSLINRILNFKERDKYFDCILRCKSDSEADEYKEKGFSIYCGENILNNPNEDILFVPPSVRRESEFLNAFRKMKVEILSDFDVFFKNNLNCFCITGSDGKSTTTEITSQILNGEKSTFPCGNFGVPFFDVPYGEYNYVCELSSFQLMNIKPHAKRSTITNISKNHLNWHKDFDEYIDAKLNIFRNCKEKVINFDDEYMAPVLKNNDIFSVYSYCHGLDFLKNKIKAEHYSYVDKNCIYTDGKKQIEIEKLKRNDICTVKNFLSAIAMTQGFTDVDNLTRVALNFTGLPHRCEKFTVLNTEFINSSIDTTPTRTLNTLLSLNKKVILILGGRDKGLDLSNLVEVLPNYTEKIYIYGECREKYLNEFKRLNLTRGVTIYSFDTLEALLLNLLKSKLAGETVLLSPSCTSFGEFKNFEERGNFFKQFIKDNRK